MAYDSRCHGKSNKKRKIEKVIDEETKSSKHSTCSPTDPRELKAPKSEPALEEIEKVTDEETKSSKLSSCLPTDPRDVDAVKHKSSAPSVDAKKPQVMQIDEEGDCAHEFWLALPNGTIVCIQ